MGDDELVREIVALDPELQGRDAEVLANILRFGSAERSTLEDAAKPDNKKMCLIPVYQQLVKNLAPSIPIPREVVKTQWLHKVWLGGDPINSIEWIWGTVKTDPAFWHQGWGVITWVYDDAIFANGSELDTQGVPTRILPAAFGCPRIIYKCAKTLLQNAGREDAFWREVERIIAALVTHRKFVTASDFLRLILLYLVGGIYCDVKMHLKINSDEAGVLDRMRVQIGVLNLAWGNENSCMLANKFDETIKAVLVSSVERFGEVLLSPEAHTDADLHEESGTWTIIDKNYRGPGNTCNIATANDWLAIINPRAVNSWTNNFYERSLHRVTCEKVLVESDAAALDDPLKSVGERLQYRVADTETPFLRTVVEAITQHRRASGPGLGQWRNQGMGGSISRTWDLDALIEDLDLLNLKVNVIVWSAIKHSVEDDFILKWPVVLGKADGGRCVHIACDHQSNRYYPVSFA